MGVTNFILDTKYIHFELIEDIMYAQYKSGLNIQLEDAQQIVNDRLLFFKDREYKIIISDQGVLTVNKAARDYFASDIGLKNIIAVAFIVKSDFSRLLANFMIGITKHAVPIKIFGNEKKALAWLKTINVN